MSEASPPELESCADAVWDAVVIGAGPAGALAAHQLATRGLRTLVVDAKRFPRAKVCGGCLNRRGIAALQTAGLQHVLEACDAASVHTLRWIVGNQQARFALPDMRVVDRALFDSVLAQEATRAGATFFDGVQACVEPQLTASGRIVTLTRQTLRVQIVARAVISADGLARSSLKRLTEISTLIVPHSRIGVGATLEHASSFARDEITMIVGRHGYVGLATSQRDRLNVAAALDPRAVAQSTVADLILEMLRAAGVSTRADWLRTDWHGTPPLTSRPNQVAAERLFVIGDASGYVEPFSGEGMATALETALAVAPLAVEAARQWRPPLAAEWESIQRELVFKQQATCRQLAWILRHSWAAAAAIGLCRLLPWVARRFVTQVS